MNTNYWVYIDYFIFTPNFDGDIEDYIVIISKYNKLIFSDHNFEDIALKIDCPDTLLYETPFICSKFNRPLGNSLNSLINLTHLTLGRNFNKPLGNSLDNLINLTHLTFGNDFNKPLGNSLDNLINLTHLTFGNDFNESLGNSLDNLINLTHLSLCGYFNHSLSNVLYCLKKLEYLDLKCYFNQELILPSNIKIIGLDCGYRNSKKKQQLCNCSHIVDNLQDSIIQLNLGEDFDSSLDNLPNSLKKIIFNEHCYFYSKKINNLPIGLEILQLPKNFNSERVIIPPNCKIFY